MDEDLETKDRFVPKHGRPMDDVRLSGTRTIMKLIAEILIFKRSIYSGSLCISRLH